METLNLIMIQFCQQWNGTGTSTSYFWLRMALMGMDCTLKTLPKVRPVHLREITKPDYSLFFIGEIAPRKFLPSALREMLC